MEKNTGWKRIVYLMCAIQVGCGNRDDRRHGVSSSFLGEIGVTDAGEAAFWAGSFQEVTPFMIALSAPSGLSRQTAALETCHVHRSCGSDTDSVSLCRVYFAVAGVYLPPAAGAGGGFVPIGLSVIASVSPEEETSRTLGYFQAAMVSGIMFYLLWEVLWRTRWGTACPWSSLAFCP